MMTRRHNTLLRLLQALRSDPEIFGDPVPGTKDEPGVLLSERGSHSTAQHLINVAISRARGKLIVVADVGYFERRAAESVVTRMVVRALAVGRREMPQR